MTTSSPHPHPHPHPPDKNDATIHRDIVLIFTPKKTGSSSLVSSIRINNANDFYVFHTHDEIILNTDPKYTEYKNICVNDILQNNIYINPLNGKPRQIYVIDIYRSPIERMMSEFFEELTTLHFNNINAHKYLTIETITRRFNNIFPYLISADYFKEKYYYIDRETSQQKLIYDMTTQPQHFDFDKRYLLIEKNNIKYIKLRLNDSKTHWSKILKDILQIENTVTIFEDYKTENKEIGELYRKFKENYRLPQKYYTMVEQCSQLKFYYTKNERKKYLHYWKQFISEIDDNIIPFNLTEYNLYIKISNENRYNFCVKNHYIDDGCLCEECSQLRKQFAETFAASYTICKKIKHTSKIIQNKNICLIYTFFHPPIHISNSKNISYDEYLSKTIIKKTYVIQ